MFFISWEMQYNENSHSFGQLVIGSFIMTTHLLLPHISCRVFWWNIQSPRWLSPLQPRFAALWLLAFPKTKITFEREEVSDCQWDSGKYDRAADGDWENCVRSQGAYLKGTEASLSFVQCSLYLVSSSINVSIFHITWLNTFWTDLIYDSHIALVTMKVPQSRILYNHYRLCCSKKVSIH